MKYPLIVDAPFDAIASAIHVLMMQAWDWDVNIPSMAAHTSFIDATVVGTCPSISLDRDDRRKLRTM
jgi:hypothetical protein